MSSKTPLTDNKIILSLLPLILAVSTSAVFWNVWTFDFVVYDDMNYVALNAFVHRGLTLESCAWAFQSIVHAIWHPITFMSFMLDVELYGMNPGGFHFTNLLLHVLNTVFLFWILRFLTGSPWKCFFVALFFAIHPLRVESVAWITERKDVLSMFFMLLSIACYVRYVRSGLKSLWWCATLILFCLGVMSKPMIVTLPAVLLLLDQWPLIRTESYYKLIAEKISMFFLSFLFCLKNLIDFKLSGMLNSVSGTTILDRFTNAAVAYNEYILKLFYPVNLTPYQMFEEIAFWKVMVSVVLLILFSVLALITFNRRPYFLVGWLWYLVTLLPVIGLIQFTPMRTGDRFTYIPCIGLLIIGVWGVAELLSKIPRIKRVLIGALLLIAFLFGLQAQKQTRVWKNTYHLFSHTLKVKPNLIPLFNDLANEAAAAGRYQQALLEYSAIINVKPDYAPAYFNMGFAYEKIGELQKARIAYEETLRLSPNHKITIERLRALEGL